MTTPNPARAALGSPRALAAWALVAYAALFLVFAFFDWVLPGDGSLIGHSAGARFTDLVVMAMPVTAVLLAVHVSPALGAARLLAGIALVEYAVALLFGLFAWLIGFGVFVDAGIHSPNGAFDLLAYLVMGVATLALIAVAAFVTYRAFVSVGGRFPVTVTRTPAAPPPPPPTA